MIDEDYYHGTGSATFWSLLGYFFPHSDYDKVPNIEDIYKAQIAAGEVEASLDENNDSESTISTISCIVVGSN